MKLAYFQSLNECDPLPKLGRKVKPFTVDHASIERTRAIRAFECRSRRIDDLDSALSTAFDALRAQPKAIGIDLATKPDTTTVSFADAAEMAEAAREGTYQEAHEAFRAARLRTSSEQAWGAWYAVMGPRPSTWGNTSRAQYRAVTAALEALR